MYKSKFEIGDEIRVIPPNLVNVGRTFKASSYSGDEGDYEPSNCRWDTKKNNSIESNAKTFRLINPEGKCIEIFNLNQFCKDNDLDRSRLYKLMKGIGNTHKGWKVCGRPLCDSCKCNH